MNLFSFARGSLVAAVLLASLPMLANAGDLSPWPLPTVPPGANPAIIPAPRDDWMEHFERNVKKSKEGPLDLILDGDSITDGWQGAGKEVWAKTYGKIAMVNEGIGGDKTENVLWRLADGQADGLKPRLIALLIGTNNLGRDTDEQIAAGIAKIVQEYQRHCPDAAILLQGIFPRGASLEDPLRIRIKNINTMISKLGDGKKVIYVDYGDMFLEPDGSLSPDIMPDGLHPNAKGYEIWAKALAPIITQFFKVTS